MLRISKPWDSQPQEAVGVDWSNPLTMGLRSSCVSVGGVFLDAISQKIPSGTFPVAKVTSTGVVAAFNGTTTTVNFGSYAGNPSQAGLTIVARLRWSSIASATRPVCIRKGGVSYQIMTGGGSGNLGAFTAGNGLGALGGAVAGQWITVFAEFNSAGTAIGVYIDKGALQALSTGSAGDATFDQYQIGSQDGGNRFFPGDIDFVHVFDRALRPEERSSIVDNPWALFAPRTIWVPVSSGGGAGVSGTLSSTLDALTGTATGTLPIVGTASPTLGALTSTASGTVAIKGTASPTLATLTSAPVAALVIQGTLSATLADATLAATGALQVAGSGAVSQTLGDATLAATGTLPITGTASQTLAGLQLAAVGVLSAPGTGTLAATLADATVASSATVLLRGSASVTLGDCTIQASGLDPGAVVTFTLNRRTHLVPAQNRTHIITPERRTRTVPRQTRTNTA